VTPHPRWFYVLIAISAIVVAVAIGYRAFRTPPDRWRHIEYGESDGIFNPSTGETCWLIQEDVECLNFDRAVIRSTKVVRLRVRK